MFPRQYVQTYLEGVKVPLGDNQSGDEPQQVKMLLRTLPQESSSPGKPSATGPRLHPVIQAFDQAKPPACYGVLLGERKVDGGGAARTAVTAFVKGYYSTEAGSTALHLYVQPLTSETEYEEGGEWACDVSWTPTGGLQGFTTTSDRSVDDRWKVVLNPVCSTVGGVSTSSTIAMQDSEGSPCVQVEPTVSFYVGNAAPPPAFAVIIPFNPMEWLLLEIPDQLDPSTSQVLGVGFMASSDVPNKPIVLFSVEGCSSEQGGEVTMSLTKRYEPFPQTIGFDLEYTGTVRSPHLNEGPVLWVGQWKNEKGMSQGLFSAQRQATVSTLSTEVDNEEESTSENESKPGMVFCRGCQRWMSIGTPVLVFDPQLPAPYHEAPTNTTTGAATSLNDSDGEDYLPVSATIDANQWSALCLDCAFPPNVPMLSLPSAATQAAMLDENTGVIKDHTLVSQYCTTPVAKFLRDEYHAKDTREVKQLLPSYGRLNGGHFLSAYSTSPADATTCASVVQASVAKFGARTLLTVFSGLDVKKPKSYSYEDLGAMSNTIIEKVSTACLASSSIMALGPHTAAIIVSDRCNTAPYFAAAMACFSQQWVVVPVPAVMGSSPAHMTNLVTDLSLLSHATSILVIDVSGGDRFSSAVRDLKLPQVAPPYVYVALDLGEVLASEVSARTLTAATVAPTDPNRAAAILFTSGTTNQASKGVVFTEELCRPTEGVSTLAPMVTLDFQTYEPTYVLSVLQTLRSGASRFLVHSMDVLTDPGCTALSHQGGPTHMGAPPTFWAQLYRDYCEQADVQGDDAPAKLVRRRFGARLQAATSGGAGISTEVFDFVREKLELPLNSLYGSREAGGIARNGAVYPGVTVKVLVAEDGSDASIIKSEGTGEILVHSPRMVSSYLGRSTNTMQDPTSGLVMLRTGDWGQVQVSEPGVPGGPPTTKVIVHGRQGNVQKMSNGEWVDLSTSEVLLEEHPHVFQSFLFKAAETVHCVVIWAESPETKATPSAEGVLAHRIRSLQQHAVAVGISFSLLPQKFLVQDRSPETEFSEGNGLLTASGKRRSKALREKYEAVLSSFVGRSSGGDGEGCDDKLEFHVPKFLCHLLPSTGTKIKLTKDDVRTMVAASEGDASDLSTATLKQLGLDSLLSVRLSQWLLHRLGSTSSAVTPAALYSMTLFELSGLVGLGMETGGRQRQLAGRLLATIGKRAELDEAFWMNELKIPSAQPTSAPAVPSREPRKSVLVIGATGFLGPHVVQQLHRLGNSVVCLGRSKSRLEADLAAVGVDLAQGSNSSTSTTPITTVEATFTADENLGLNKQQNVLMRIVDTVGTIILNAASVNHVSPYSSLKGVNVDASLNVVGFALRHHMNLVLVSSVAAERAGAVRSSKLPFEPLSAKEMVAKNGDPYGQTKAVLEALAAEAFARMASPPRLSFVRPGLISPPTAGKQRGNGSRNENDLTSTLLDAMEAVQAVPWPIHLDLHCVPVDFVGGIIAKVADSQWGQIDNSSSDGAAATPYYCNIMNSGPLLEDIVSWKLEEAERQGFPWKQVPAAEFQTLVRNYVETREASTGGVGSSTWSEQRVASMKLIERFRFAPDGWTADSPAMKEGDKNVGCLDNQSLGALLEPGEVDRAAWPVSDLADFWSSKK